MVCAYGVNVKIFDNVDRLIDYGAMLEIRILSAHINMTLRYLH